MAIKVNAYPAWAVVGAPVKASAAATILNGKFMGVNSSGEMLPADFRASAGPVVAHGACIQNAQLTDFRGNVIDTPVMGSFTKEGRIGGFTGLTPGATMYLLSGGGVQATKPAATTNDIDQVVGFAITATDIEIQINPQPVVHA